MSSIGWVCVVPGVQQGATNFLLGALEIRYPGATFITKGWFSWLLVSVGLFFAMTPNIISQRVLRIYFRFAVGIFFSLLLMYWIWFPIKARGRFQSHEGVFGRFYNGINLGEKKEASDGYCWVVSVLFGAWVFYGYGECFRWSIDQHPSLIFIRRVSTSGRGNPGRIRGSRERHVDVYLICVAHEH